MSTPQTNKFFGVKVSKQGIPVNKASDKQLIYKDDFSTKTYYDQTDARMVEGKLPDGSYGLWTSQVGVDVTTASTGQLTFNSNASFTVALANTFDFPPQVVAGGGSASVNQTIPHNLGYTPGYAVFTPIFVFPFGGTAQSTPYVTQNPSSVYATGVTDISYSIAAFVDNTNLYLELNLTSAAVGGTTPTITIKYFVYTSQVI